MAVNFLRCRRAPKGDSSLKLQKFWVALCLFVSSLSLQTLPTQANTNAIDAYKIYAHIKVGNYKEFVCLEKLWTKFGEIPIDEDECIEQEFLNFPKGTEKMEVWQHFDELHSKGVAWLVFGKKSII